MRIHRKKNCHFFTFSDKSDLNRDILMKITSLELRVYAKFDA